MTDFKSTQKQNVGNNTDLSSISGVLKILNTAFNLPQKPATPIPPFLLLIGARSRPGMSGRNLAANVISDLENKAGLVMGNIFADGDNRDALAERVRWENAVSHIQTNAKVSCVLEPASVQVLVTGTAGPFPVVAQGGNVTAPVLDGIMT